MDNSEDEELRWRVVKATLDDFPELRKRVKEYLREENKGKEGKG